MCERDCCAFNLLRMSIRPRGGGGVGMEGAEGGRVEGEKERRDLTQKCPVLSMPVTTKRH